MMKSLLFALSLAVAAPAFSAEPVIPSTEDLVQATAPAAAPTELQVEAPSTDFAAAVETVASSEANTPVVAAEGAAPKNEADIPVELDAKVAGKTSEGSLRELMLAAALLAGFGLLAWLGLTKLRSRNVKTSQFQMKILAQHHLGPKKSLMVVRVAGESILIGVTDQNITMLKSLALLDEDIPEEAPTSFGGIFSKQNIADDTATAEAPAGPSSLKEAAKQESRFSFRRREEVSEAEDFTISKIRDVVHRQVRNLKSLE